MQQSQQTSGLLNYTGHYHLDRTLSFSHKLSLAKFITFLHGSGSYVSKVLLRKKLPNHSYRHPRMPMIFKQARSTVLDRFAYSVHKGLVKKLSRNENLSGNSKKYSGQTFIRVSLEISIILHCGILSNMPKCKCSLNLPLWEPSHPVPIWQFLEFCHCSCSADHRVYQPSCRLWNDHSHFQVHPESTSKCQQANRIINFSLSSFYQILTFTKTWTQSDRIESLSSLANFLEIKENYIVVQLKYLGLSFPVTLISVNIIQREAEKEHVLWACYSSLPYLIYYYQVSNTMHHSQIYHFKVFLCQHITSIKNKCDWPCITFLCSHWKPH